MNMTRLRLTEGLAGDRTRALLTLACASLLWVAVATLIVPPIIESAYRGDSLPIFNSFIQAQHLYPVEHYQRKWNSVTLRVLLVLLVVYLSALFISRPSFLRKYVGEATPGSLGAIRMWTCLILLLTLSLEDLGSVALIPPELRNPAGVMRLFHYLPIHFDRFLGSETSLRAFHALTAALLFLGAIGWWTRVVIPLGALCGFVLVGILIDHSFFWHQNLAALYVMAVLAWTPCGDGWSVDRLWKIHRNRPVPDASRAAPIYGWSRYACWIVIAVPYVATGVSKLRVGGFYWWNATNMRSMLYSDTLSPREFPWAFSLYLAPAPDLVFALLGITALLTEASFGLVLFSRTARRVLPLAAMMTHVGILLFQRILFLDLILLQFVFFDFTTIRQAIGRRLTARRGKIQILYDGLCPLCLRTVRMLSSLDVFGRLELVDFRHLDLTDYNRRHAVSLQPRDLEQEMYVVSRGRPYQGFYGYRVIALALPAFWPLAPWLFLPGLSRLGVWAYSYVARKRFNLIACDSHCPVSSSTESAPVVITPIDPSSSRAPRAPRAFRYALAISSLIVVAVICWLDNFEFYPLTSWHLYSGSDTSGRITYLRIFGHYESGETLPVRLEDGIGALAFDGRYSPALDKCVEQKKPKDVEICQKFLTANASAYNGRRRPGQKLTHYEIQEWAWDFRSDPSHPDYGTLTKRQVFDVTRR